MDNLCSYFTGLNSEEEHMFFLPSRLLFDEALDKLNIVNVMEFQIENPLDKGRFNDILSKEFNRR